MCYTTKHSGGELGKDKRRRIETVERGCGGEWVDVARK
jgi:hypothetical protein